MRIEKMSEYAQFNLRMIREQGSQAEQTRKLVEEMRQQQKMNEAKLAAPSEHMQKFTSAMKKLDVI